MRLGGVGEGLWVIDWAQPLTQLQLGSKLPSFHNPLPLERELCRYFCYLTNNRYLRRSIHRQMPRQSRIRKRLNLQLIRHKAAFAVKAQRPGAV